MRLLSLSSILTVAALSAGLAAPGHAATVSGTYNFSATSFTPGSPFLTVMGAVTLSFDSTTTSTAPVISFSSTTLTVASTLEYTYLQAGDNLTIGGINATVFTTDPTTSDFALQISNATSANPKVTTFSYSTGSNAVYSATGNANTVTFTPAVVPEPASGALIGAGLVGAGLMRRKRRKF